MWKIKSFLSRMPHLQTENLNNVHFLRNVPLNQKKYNPSVNYETPSQLWTLYLVPSSFHPKWGWPQYHVTVVNQISPIFILLIIFYPIKMTYILFHFAVLKYTVYFIKCKRKFALYNWNDKIEKLEPREQILHSLPPTPLWGLLFLNFNISLTLRPDSHYTD